MLQVKQGPSATPTDERAQFARNKELMQQGLRGERLASPMLYRSPPRKKQGQRPYSARARLSGITLTSLRTLSRKSAHCCIISRRCGRNAVRL